MRGFRCVGSRELPQSRAPSHASARRRSREPAGGRNHRRLRASSPRVTTVDLDTLIADARVEGQRRMDVARRQFDLGTWSRFDLDLTVATISFRDDAGLVRVSADLQVAGTWSRGSWMWPWDNESVPFGARSRLDAVRAFGRAQELDLFVDSFEPCDEGEAWSMAAVAAAQLDAACIYRVPRPRALLFLLLFDLRWVLRA